MKKHHSTTGYLFFSFPRGREVISPEEWIAMLNEVDLASFVARENLAKRVNVKRCAAIHVSVFNDEGDEWVLSILQLEDSSANTRYFLLPLVRTILPAPEGPFWLPIHRVLTQHPERIAFGFETRSDFYGSRQWVVFNATQTPDELLFLFQLFWPDELFYSLTVVRGETGGLGWRVDEPPPSGLPGSETRVEQAETGELLIGTTDLRLRLGGSFSVEEGREIGRMDYLKSESEVVPIGVLERVLS